ncbi:MAG TPA: ankyrin repeat domain-containing protein [Candidatus Babeliales bacterium]|nr:ankyrin repeat domain-containing protein [Candidatus Babeliales bacterium]
MRLLHLFLTALLLCTATHNSFPAAAAQPAAAEIDPTVRSLLIFLDDSEPYYYDASDPLHDSHLRAMTTQSMGALADIAGPILISGSLLYNLFREPKAYDKNKNKFDEFYNNFNLDNWIIKKIKTTKIQKTTLYCMIPNNYLGVSHDSLQQLNNLAPLTELEYKLGLKIDHMDPIPAKNKQEIRDYLTAHYDNYTTKNYYILNDETGNDFKKNCIDEKKIFVSKNDHIKNEKTPVRWIIYSNGHGIYNHNIAQLSFKQFDTFLNFLEKDILTIFFAVTSCYAAGFNMQKIFGELTTKGGAKTLPFPIVTHALTDAVVHKLSQPYDFKLFIDILSQNSPNYKKAIATIMPIGQKIINTPQIRFPHVPAWFPITQSDDAIIRITKIQSVTRKKPLTVNDKPVLLYTNYVPFLINFSSSNPKPLISMIAGDTLHTIDSATLLAHDSVTNLFENMHIIKYGSSKTFFIKKATLKILNTNITDILIQYLPHKKPLCFFTEQGQQKTYINGKIENYKKNNYMRMYNKVYSFKNDFLEPIRTNTKKIEHALLHQKIKLDVFSTLLHSENRVEAKKLIQHLIDKGINIDFRNQQQQTPLIIAAQNGDEEIVELLLIAGANKDKCDANGFNAADAARNAGYEDIAILIENGDNIKLRQLIKLQLYPHLDFSSRRNLRYILEQVEKKSPKALDILKNIVFQLIHGREQQAANTTSSAYRGSSYWGKDFPIQEFEQKKWQEILTSLMDDKDISALLDNYTPKLSPQEQPEEERKEGEQEVPAGLML